MEEHAISYDGYNQTGLEEACHTLRITSGGEAMDTTPKVAQVSPTSYIVRRLTPIECERLMGYPDGYTIPKGLQITDELVDEFIEIFANFAQIENPNKPVKRKSAKQVRSWLEKIKDPNTCPDAPRYKACGNGWAINCAQFVLQGINRFLDEVKNA